MTLFMGILIGMALCALGAKLLRGCLDAIAPRYRAALRDEKEKGRAAHKQLYDEIYR